MSKGTKSIVTVLYRNGLEESFESDEDVATARHFLLEHFRDDRTWHSHHPELNVLHTIRFSEVVRVRVAPA